MLTQFLMDDLYGQAENAAPEEFCGLLFDQVCVAAKNRAADPLHEFLIGHEDYVKICMFMDEKPWAIVHSHVTKGAGLSPTDCKLMDALEVAKQELAMVIVGLHPREIRIFRKQNGLYILQWTRECSAPVATA